MTSVVACIPTIGLSDDLEDLVHALFSQGVPSWLYINSEGVPESLVRLIEGWPDQAWPWPELNHVPDQSIYVSWNQAARRARELDAHLLVLNDDIVIPYGLVTSLHDALEGESTYGLIGVASADAVNEAPYSVQVVSHSLGNRYRFSAWCFIARPSMWQDVDDRYRIWYGDDDLIWKMNAAGHGVGRLIGTGVEHHVSTTSRQLPWAMAAAHDDGVLWMSTGH